MTPVRARASHAVWLTLGLAGVACGGIMACGGGTSLSPLSVQRLLGAERTTAAIVTRHDGGMPSADRLLAASAYCVIDGVMQEAKVAGIDAGIPCK